VGSSDSIGVTERSARHDERADAFVTVRPGLAGDDDDLVGGRPVQHRFLGPAQHDVIAGGGSGGRDPGRVVAPAFLCQRERAGDVTGGDRAEEVRLLLSRAEFTNGGRELGDGGEEGAGREHPAELLDDYRDLDHPETEPAGVGRDGEGGPPELHHVGPERVRCEVFLDHPTHDVHAAFVSEHGAHRAA